MHRELVKTYSIPAINDVLTAVEDDVESLRGIGYRLSCTIETYESLYEKVKENVKSYVEYTKKTAKRYKEVKKLLLQYLPETEHPENKIKKEGHVL